MKSNDEYAYTSPYNLWTGPRERLTQGAGPQGSTLRTAIIIANNDKKDDVKRLAVKWPHVLYGYYHQRYTTNGTHDILESVGVTSTKLGHAEEGDFEAIKVIEKKISDGYDVDLFFFKSEMTDPHEYAKNALLGEALRRNWSLFLTASATSKYWAGVQLRASVYSFDRRSKDAYSIEHMN